MLAVGRALMARPRLLMLDEPTTGLAPVIAQIAFEALEGLAAGYLGERVVEGIDLEVRTGEAVAIVGSNGRRAAASASAARGSMGSPLTRCGTGGSRWRCRGRSRSGR